MINIFSMLKDYKRKILISICLILSVFLIAFASYNINKLFANLSGDTIPANSAFDDINFYNCVIENYNKYSKTKIEDKLENTNLTDAELESIDKLYCNNKNITSIKGIEKLKGITIFSSTGNNITSVDLSENTFLEKVLLSRNKISHININNNIALTAISVANNELTNIDVSNNSNLSILDIDNNHLEKLILDNNDKIKSLSLSYNNLTELNVDNLLLLEKLLIDNNKITKINLTNNTKLNELDISKSPISYLDISKNTNLNAFGLLDTNLSQKIPVMGIGDTYEIIDNIKVPDGYNIKYSVLDEKVAKIENGKIIALSPGKTILEVKFNFPRELSVRSNIEVAKASISSDKYIIKDDEKIIYTKNDTNIDTIISNIKTNIGKVVIEDGKVKVVSGNNTHLEYKLVNYDTDYQIKDDYILIKDSIFDINKIKTNNDDLIVDYNKEDNIVNIKYKDTIIDTLKIASYKIKDYEILTDSEKQKYIYLQGKAFDESKINTTNCSYEITDNKLIIKAGDNVLDTIYLSNISIKDSKYEINNSSVYVDVNDFSLSDIICDNVRIEDNGNYTYKIIVADKVVDTIKVIKLDISDSSKKDILNKYGYIYVGIRKITNLDDFKVINGYIKENDNEIILYTDEDKKNIVKTIKLLKISSDKYDLEGGYSKKDNGYYIFERNINTSLINISNELIIKESNDGNYVIALKEDGTEFETIYPSYIIEDSRYDLKDDYVYYGLINNNLTLKVKNGYYQRNNNTFDIYLNNGKKVKTINIVALITDYASNNNYDFKNGVLDLDDEVFNPLYITERINADIKYSTKDNILSILYNGKVIKKIKINSKSSKENTKKLSTTTIKENNAEEKISTTKVTTNKTTTTKLETRSNRITTKSVGNKNSTCSRCRMIKIFAISLAIVYILYIMYVIYVYRREKDRKEV